MSKKDDNSIENHKNYVKFEDVEKHNLKDKNKSKKKLRFSKFKRKSKKNFAYTLTIILIKISLIAFIIFGLYDKDNSFSNTVGLLAVSENGAGEIVSGSVIDLTLKVKSGTGQVYVNQESLQEIDTQISIYNSNKIACNIFKLDCENYDFYYSFDAENSLVLKGPSASSAIAILTAKTLNKEHIKTEKVVITGSLNSGGLVGVVGGVDKKIETALANDYDKVLVPAFADFNKTKEYKNIDVIRVIDIVDAYNEFNGDKYELNLEKVKSSEYQLLMKQLSDDMCARGVGLLDRIDLNLIDENSTNRVLLNNSKNSIEDANKSSELGNYYSMGSFCYSANINYRMILENQKNLSLEQVNDLINEFKVEIDNRIDLFSSHEYKKNIKTLNDFYVYLVLIDRTYEALDFIKEAQDIKIDLMNNSSLGDNESNSTNENSDEKFNLTVKDSGAKINFELNESSIKKIEERIKNQKVSLYSVAYERYYTVSLWEKFIDNLGKEISFSDFKVADVCSKINREISIKNELMHTYEISAFDSIIYDQLKLEKDFENKYLCIYKGLELDGRINTVLNSVGITTNNDTEYVEQFVKLTSERINLNSNGVFPFIPTIYSEYSSDLISNGDVSSGLLYSNYAMSYSNLNIYLDDKEKIEFEKVTKDYFDRLFENLLFVVALLVVAVFLN